MTGELDDSFTFPQDYFYLKIEDCYIIHIILLVFLLFYYSVVSM